MKMEVQYVCDHKGRPKAVQVPVEDWEKLLSKLKKYEQALKIRTDLKEAYSQVEALKKSRARKTSLSEFVNEL
jgi:hypothetical protein